MANPVTIDLLDGEVRALKFGSRALADFEKEIGQSFYRVMREPPGFLHVQGLIWAGLRWQNPFLTYDAAGELVDAYLERDGRLLDLWPPIVAALFEARILRERAKPNGHDKEAADPNEPSEKGPTSSSPTGSSE